MFHRTLVFFGKKIALSLRNIIRSSLLSLKILARGEISKEACVLSYYGLFSCVPVLVFFLRLTQYLFGNSTWIEWLLFKLPDYKEPIEAIVAAAQNSSGIPVGSVIVASFFVFCWPAIFMLMSLEDSLNKVFRAGWTPLSVQRIVVYLIITLIAPMVFIIAFGSWIYITQIMPLAYTKLFQLSYTMSTVFFLSRIAPYVFLYVILFCCYAFLPRVPIQKNAALQAAFVAGTVWLVLQKLFFGLQIYLFNYSFTYGALVALPSFLLLLYLYSMIYLFGGTLTFTIQNHGDAGNSATENGIPNSYLKLVISTYILAFIFHCFNKRLSPPSATTIAKSAHISIGEVSQCLALLEKEGFILLYKEAYKPSYNFAHLTIQDVIEQLINLHSFAHISSDCTFSLIQQHLLEIFAYAKSATSNATLEALSKEIQ